MNIYIIKFLLVFTGLIIFFTAQGKFEKQGFTKHTVIRFCLFVINVILFVVPNEVYHGLSPFVYRLEVLSVFSFLGAVIACIYVIKFAFAGETAKAVFSFVLCFILSATPTLVQLF